MREQQMRRRYIFSSAAIVGAILILLSMYFPWFYFTGTAEYYGGSVEVSGQIWDFGVGTLDETNARVTMWSSSTYWSTAKSDFWFGYLSVVGLILVSASILVFMKTFKPKISTLLALIGGPMAVLAILIPMIYYKPYVFIIFGQIDTLPIDGARLYATQAIVRIGLGPWLSFIGGFIATISMMVSPFYHKIR